VKLKYPDSDFDFVVGPAYFVAQFDVYDREETLGVEYGQFDPNDPKQLTALLRKHFFESPWIARHSVEHRVELTRILKLALDSNFDFAPLFDPYAIGASSALEYYSLPWRVRDPRGFFEELYRLAREYW
jgi:hypothetical protein